MPENYAHFIIWHNVNGDENDLANFIAVKRLPYNLSIQTAPLIVKSGYLEKLLQNCCATTWQSERLNQKSSVIRIQPLFIFTRDSL